MEEGPGYSRDSTQAAKSRVITKDERGGPRGGYKGWRWGEVGEEFRRGKFVLLRQEKWEVTVPLTEPRRAPAGLSTHPEPGTLT